MKTPISEHRLFETLETSSPHRQQNPSKVPAKPSKSSPRNLSTVPNPTAANGQAVVDFAYLLQAARECIQRGDFDDAQTMLSEAGKQAADAPRRLAQVAEVQQDWASRRQGREDGIEQRLQAIRKSLDAGELMEADRHLFQAVELHGPDPRFDDYRHKLEQLHLQELESDIRSMMTQAVELCRIGKDVEALEIIDKAKAVAPPRGKELIGELESTAEYLRQLSVRQRQERLAEAKAEVSQHLAVFDLSAARACASGAEQGLGSPDAVTDLRRFLQWRISETVHGEIHAARQAFHEADYGVAIGHLRRALALKPGDTWIEEQLRASSDRQQQQEKERRHDPVWTDCLAAIEDAIAGQRFDEASHRLGAAIGQWGQGASLDHLQQQLSAERGDAVRQLLDAARQAHRENDVDTAQKRLDEALKMDPEDPSAQNMAEVLARPQPALELSEAPPEALAAIEELHRLCEESAFLEAWRNVQRAIDAFGELQPLVALRRRIAEEVLDGF